MIRYLLSILFFVLSSACEAAVTKLSTEEITALFKEPARGSTVKNSEPTIYTGTSKISGSRYGERPLFRLGETMSNALVLVHGKIFNIRGFAPCVICEVSYNGESEFWVFSFKKNKIHCVQIFASSPAQKTKDFTQEDILLRANHFLPVASHINEKTKWTTKTDKEKVATINDYTITKGIEKDLPYIIICSSQEEDDPAIPFLSPDIIRLKDKVLFEQSKRPLSKFIAYNKRTHSNDFYYKALDVDLDKTSHFTIGDSIEKVIAHTEGIINYEYKYQGILILLDAKDGDHIEMWGIGFKNGIFSKINISKMLGTTDQDEYSREEAIRSANYFLPPEHKFNINTKWKDDETYNDIEKTINGRYVLTKVNGGVLSCIELRFIDEK